VGNTTGFESSSNLFKNSLTAKLVKHCTITVRIIHSKIFHMQFWHSNISYLKMENGNTLSTRLYVSKLDVRKEQVWQTVYLLFFFLHVCLWLMFSFPFFVKHCNINLVCECYSCTSTEIHCKTKLLHGVIPMFPLPVPRQNGYMYATNQSISYLLKSAISYTITLITRVSMDIVSGRTKRISLSACIYM